MQLADKKPIVSVSEAMLKRIFKGELKDGEIHQDYYFDVAKKLAQAVQKGMGKSTAIESKKTALFDKLKSNVYAFSAAKNLAMMQEFRKQLTDENNEVRSYAAFRNAVTEVDVEFNDNHLRTEYNSAISMAQMADKWDSLQQYEYLEYRTVGDNRVRKSHEKLDGLVLRTDDKLWEKIYPPNDWGCRCTVIPVNKGVIDENRRQEADTFSKQGIKPYFRRNAGIEQTVFTDEHPYFTRFSHDIKKGKVHQFMAEENYAMPSVENILKQELPKLQRATSVEDAKVTWEAADKHISTADGLEWDMTNQWNHVVTESKQDRWKYINNAKDVLENADEVWSYRETEGNNNATKVFKKYVKYYEGQPVVFSYDIDNPDDWTMYTANADETGRYSKMRERVRRGILLHRKAG